MISFNYCKKWLLKILPFISIIGAGFLTFQIISCDPVQFQAIPEYNCEAETLVDVVSCSDT